MSITNSDIRRNFGFFHSLSKAMVLATQNVYESGYKSSHNVRLGEVWADDVNTAFTLPQAEDEVLNNPAVTLYEMVDLTPIPGTNNQAYYLDDGGMFVRPWIAPTDIPDPITNAPSNGYRLRLYRENETEITPTFGSWEINYYAGIIHFAPGQTPIDLGFGQIKASIFVYTGAYGASGATASMNVNNVGGGEEIFRDISGTTINLRTIIGSGDTTVTTSGDTVIINSVGGGTGGTDNITASNGLQRIGDDIVLGGTLTGDTYIDTDSNVFELNNLGEFWLRTNDGHEVYFSDQAGFVLTGTNVFEFEPTSLVTKEYVDGNVIEANAGDTIPLPLNPQHKDRVVVVDVSGGAELNPITVTGNGNNILNGTEAHINTNYGSITLYYNINNFWSVIAFTN